MNPKERVITALSRKVPDRIPFEFSLTPHLQKIFEEKTGAKDPRKYFGMEMRHVGLRDMKIKQDFSRYLPDDPQLSEIDEYGIGYVKGSQYHFRKRVHPMQGLKTVKEIEEYPFPDIFADYRYESKPEEIEELHRRELFVT